MRRCCCGGVVDGCGARIPTARWSAPDVWREIEVSHPFGRERRKDEARSIEGEPEVKKLALRFPTLSAKNAERMGHSPSRENPR
jgi:hypothetical protein